jgi:threonylcarbamoyladenosine tRNA methylthiotransferase MtaB
MKRVAFYTQGCRLNQSETASLEQGFEKNNYQIVDFGPNADIFVVNTCTVTENGDADTRRLVNKINRFNENAEIALIGCQSQILKEKLLELKNVRWVIGNAEKMNLYSIVKESIDKPLVLTEKIKREPFTVKNSGVDNHHTRANIKIQDGCDFYCAFCVIPFARGPARSRVFDDIIREVVDLVNAGHKEIVITGINVGTYDVDGKKIDDVVNALSRIEGLERIRISSIEPTTIPENLIQWMTTKPKMCRYLHIPIQSGSNDVLKAMNRHYTTQEFREFVTFAHETVPEICIGTDVIVGFPGETKEHFDETVANLMTLPLDYFHVFSYSERMYARSKKLDNQVEPKEIERRSKILRDLSKKKKQAYHERFIGKTVTVLFEQEKHGYWTGLTDNYIRVKVVSDSPLKNQMRQVKLTQIDNASVIGELLPDML